MNNKIVSVGIIVAVIIAGIFILPSAMAQFTDPDKTKATIFQYADGYTSPTNPEFNISLRYFVIYSQCTRAFTYNPIVEDVIIDVNLSKSNKLNQSILDGVIEEGHLIGCDIKNGNKINGVLFTEGWKYFCQFIRL